MSDVFADGRRFDFPPEPPSLVQISARKYRMLLFPVLQAIGFGVQGLWRGLHPMSDLPTIRGLYYASGTFFSHAILVILENPCFQYLDLLSRPVFGPSLDQAHSLYNSQSTFDPTKYCVLPIQPRCWRKCDEKLASICIRTAVRHAQDSSASMFERCVYFIFELLTVDGASPTSGSSWVSSLYHEIRYYSVDDNIIVVTSLRERSEVLASL